jgi:hypothetical protein
MDEQQHPQQKVAEIVFDLEYEADPERYDSGTSAKLRSPSDRLYAFVTCETNVEPNYPGGNAVVACDGGAVRSDSRAESHSGLATILANLSEPTRTAHVGIR